MLVRITISRPTAAVQLAFWAASCSSVIRRFSAAICMIVTCKLGTLYLTFLVGLQTFTHLDGRIATVRLRQHIGLRAVQKHHRYGDIVAAVARHGKHRLILAGRVGHIVDDNDGPGAGRLSASRLVDERAVAALHDNNAAVNVCSVLEGCTETII